METPMIQTSDWHPPMKIRIPKKTERTTICRPNLASVSPINLGTL
jgi:hypothetical protein